MRSILIILNIKTESEIRMSSRVMINNCNRGFIEYTDLTSNRSTSVNRFLALSVNKKTRMQHASAYIPERYNAGQTLPMSSNLSSNSPDFFGVGS